MSSELMWLIGFVMIAASLGILWNRRMSTVAQAADSPHYHDDEAETETIRYQAMPGLTPAARTIEVTEIPIVQGQVDPVAEQSKLEPEPLEESGEVQLILRLAIQLQEAGDLEGVSEFAELVLEDTRASESQRAMAHSLLRRESIA